MRISVKRGLIGLVAILLVAGGLLTVAWRLAGRGLVEDLIAEALEERGVSVSALTLRSIGIDAAELTDIRLELGGALSIRSLEAHYRLGQLLGERRVDRIVVSGVRVDLASPAGDLPIAPPPSGLPALPVGSIEMQDGAVTLATPAGNLDLAVDLKALPLAEGGIDVSGRATLRADAGQVSATFSGGISAAGGFTVAMAPDAGRLGWGGATMDIRDGKADLAGTLAGLETIDASLAADVAMPDGTTAALGASGRLAGQHGRLVAVLESSDGADRITLDASIVDLDRPFPVIDLGLEAAPGLLGQGLALAGIGTNWSPDGLVTASLAGTLDRTAETAFPSFGGGLAITADLESAGSGQRLAMGLLASLDVDGTTARLEIDPPMRLSWGPGPGDEATTLTLGQLARAFEVTVESVGTGWAVGADGPFALFDRSGSASGVLQLSVSADRTDTGLAGRLAVEIGVSGKLGDLAIDGGRAELSGSHALDDGRWRIEADGCLPMGADRVIFAAAVSFPDGVSGCAAAMPDHPLIEIDPSQDEHFTAGLVVRTDPAGMILDTGTADPVALELEMPEAAISAASGTAGGLSAEVAIRDAAVRLAGPGLAVEGLALTASAAPSGAVPLRLHLDGGALRPLTDPGWFVPLRLTGEATWPASGPLIFSGRALGAAGAIAAALDGRHELASGVGGLSVRLQPIAFAPGVRQPADISPALRSVPIESLTGSVAGSARLDWGRTLSSSGELRLDDVSVTMLGATLRGIDGTLQADSLLPLNLPDGQLLALGGADVGLALEAGAVAFGLADGNRLSVQGIGFGLAGGSLAVEPFETGLEERGQPFVVTLQGVDLAELSKQAPLEGLSITGRMDGRIPVRLIDDTISIENGVLESTEPGVIRYVAALPVGPEGEGAVALLMNAVSNFQYQGLRAELNGRTGEDLAVSIRLTGANPELYDGFPIALNINLSGALDQVLRSGLNSLAIAEDAGDLLRGE